MTGTERPAFLDSNVLLYLLADEPRKVALVRALLKRRPTISVQVLNEITNVCRRKLGLAWDEIGELIDVIRQLCTVTPLSLETHDLARHIAPRYGMAFYDACIVAAAMLADCRILHTEDMHHGLKVAPNLTIVNPFN
ncbi:PIN domain-containing protein [Achromobacter aloeverae]|uniref:Ribonuclease VapC n=1 Tax=Achromobacter aloeverae TaxID=1750518 RepID=A0A4Q1HDT2_9BURK|nr:PIN domain-containing protein [Achromobacter aloeverae]RXN84382.1 VapC toxin family PIN domain ribonuclease [Achromobacter aloeverae]